MSTGTHEAGNAPGASPAPAPPPVGSAPAGDVAGDHDAGGRRHWLPAAVARGIALFFGVFTLLSVVGTLREPAFDANIWWVAAPYVPDLVAGLVFALVGVAFVAYAVAPGMRAWRRWSTLALFALFAAAAVYNAVEFYRVWRAGEIEPGVPLPLSVVVAAVLGFLLWAAARAPARRGWPAAAVLAAVAALCIILFPLAQVFFFGTTDYRRPADVAVVFGAQVHGGGNPSTSLRDRVVTAAQLYEDETVTRVFVSGGVGESGYNEALVMRELLEELGVPRGKVVVDSAGVNTDATVTNTVPFFGGEDWQRIIAVSQFYHLPRIKLAYQRAGWDVLTVPAAATTPIKETPRLVAREIPAFWLYYLRAVFG
jgi:vancomycin permeability regulator SanA